MIGFIEIPSLIVATWLLLIILNKVSKRTSEKNKHITQEYTRKEIDRIQKEWCDEQRQKYNGA
jgi:hypothetical protein